MGPSDTRPSHAKVLDMPRRVSHRQTVPIEGDEDLQLNPLDLPPTYEEASATAVGSGGGGGIGGGSEPGTGAAATTTRPHRSGAGHNFRDDDDDDDNDDDDDDDNINAINAALLGGHRPDRVPGENMAASSPSPSPSPPINTRGYCSTQPMAWDERERNGDWDKFTTPGFCFSTRAGCFFSDRAGCCFSDRSGCFFSDSEGCCFSNRGGCFCSDTAGCCFSSGGACCCSEAPDAVKRNNGVRL